MNWMTSGRHRALYSQRGRRRQMHFPSQAQRQRVKATSPQQNSQPARERDSTTPWYILPVGDDDESQDIRVLELERKSAMTAVAEKDGQSDPASDCGAMGGMEMSPKRKRSDGCQDVREERKETRCIFTPVKKARKYDQLPERAKTIRGDRPPSSIASGVDLLFFNDGQELLHKNRAQRVNQVSAESNPLETNDRRLSLRNGQQEIQQNYQDDDLHSRGFETHHLCGEENGNFPDRHVFPHNTSPDQHSHQLWSSNSCVGSGPDSASDHPVSVFNPSTPPSSPFEASPLSFRMSRTEVLQTQISTKEHDPLGTRMSFSPSPHALPSPSTSTSSQGSIVLGRPPLGWQNKLLLSLKENTVQKTEECLDNFGGDRNPLSPTKFADNNLESADGSNNSREVLLESSSSPGSSAGSDGGNLISNTIVPIDAKERIMAAVTSQHHPEDSQTLFQRQSTTDATTVFSEKSSLAFQQSWAMSSRTQAVLDAVSSSKASSSQNATPKHTTKHQEMESIAIYMYTLVQCYKIDEKIRTDEYCSPIAGHAQLVSTATSPPPISVLTNQSPCRREIIFSPKRTN